MQDRYPEAEANIFSRLVFQWMQPILTTGYKRPLEKQDTFLTTPSLSAEKQANDLAAAWEKQLATPKPSLLRAINNVYGRVFWPAGIVKLIGDIVTVVSPLLLEAMTKFVTQSHLAKQTGRPLPNVWTGYSYAIVLFFLQIIGTFTMHIYFHAVTKVGVQLKTALITNVYRKSLILSPKARQEFTSGKIVNLMSTDTSRLDMISSMFHGLWCNPVQILIAGGLLINNIGVSALTGFSLLVLIGPVQAYIMKRLIVIRKKVAGFTDKRVRLTQEMLNGIRIIKFFAWEASFLKALMNIRDLEIKYARRLLMVRVAVLNVAMTMPVLASTVSIIVYAALGNKLDAATVFSVIALFNAVRVPLILLPTVLAMTADAMVSLKRLEQLMLAEELEPMPEADPELKYALDMRDADYVWETVPQGDGLHKVLLTSSKPGTSAGANKDSSKKKKKDKKKDSEKEEPIVEISNEEEVEIPATRSSGRLQDINFQVARGSLVAVVGQVGSGKSSLLSALVGEMKREKGNLSFGGSVAYCPQTAWIQNATVRENILFGSGYDDSKYRRVIYSCALEHDLEILPDGDETEIGERGITLSGGQKQRLNIARAVYSGSDIVLLDDPLSAVDAHVGRHIFEKCILQELSNRTRVLVTHQLHFLPRVDSIVVMDRGRIAQQGTYYELMQQPGIFQSLMQEYGGVEQDNGEPPIDIETLKTADEETLLKLELRRTKTKEVAAPVIEEKPQPERHALMTKEERATGAVEWHVYRDYFIAAGGLFTVGLLLLLVILTQVSRALTDLWLSWWSGKLFNFTFGFYMGIYAMWGFVQVLFNIIQGLYFAILALIASNTLHKNAVRSVFRAPVSFFDTTPLGRIINRFSKDIDSTDFQLSDSFRMFLSTASTIISIFIFICVIFPFFLLPLIPLLGIFYFFQLYYRSTSRELKRLDSITRSPLFAHFSESLTGLATIRAYRAQEAFKRRNQELADDNNKAYFLSVSIQRWLGIRSETIVSFLTFFVMLFAVISRNSVSPGLVGLIISYTLQVSGMFTWAVRQSAEVENNMNAVERLGYYIDHLDHEAPAEIPATKPEKGWPDKGAISVRDLEMRYRPDLPLVLHGVSFEVKGGEKVGIVGRTGSGKSSILMALFRMVESCGGSILIDGKDIATLGLKDLRSNLAIIPQDPTLFTGTFRTNLDPFSLHTDQELWEALRRADMNRYVSEQPNGLDSEISEGGENLSAGQRQLVCLARAILVQAKILVMDEATASVDLQTDGFLQKAIRVDFEGCTILTIAHRLNTVIDYDKIIVLDNGYVREFGSPRELLENEQGVFTSMVNETGTTNAAMLKAMAKGEIINQASIDTAPSQ